MSLDHQWNPDPGTRAGGLDLRIAVTHPSGRVDKVVSPMRAAGIEVSVEPAHPREYDAIFLDQPGAAMAIPALRRDDTPVVYRIRGNLWRASNYWTLGALKSELSDRVLFPALDGAIPCDQYLETEFQNRCGNTATDAIGFRMAAARCSIAGCTSPAYKRYIRYQYC